MMTFRMVSIEWPWQTWNSIMCGSTMAHRDNACSRASFSSGNQAIPCVNTPLQQFADRLHHAACSAATGQQTPFGISRLECLVWGSCIPCFIAFQHLGNLEGDAACHMTTGVCSLQCLGLLTHTGKELESEHVQSNGLLTKQEERLLGPRECSALENQGLNISHPYVNPPIQPYSINHRPAQTGAQTPATNSWLSSQALSTQLWN